ncbi:MAG: YggT family protein [Rhodospirillales bacterium]|jgi:YggT family protein|nr:YggT family protein [Rhodospirillales bacterium]MDK9722885.1 YggT family protein [Rhodospirillales bacterium]
MDVVLVPLLGLVNVVIELYIYALVGVVILSWLVAFGVVNNRNNFVLSVQRFLYRITEPLLAPIRRVLPDLGGVDLSPMVLILGLWFFQGMLGRLAARLL